MDIEGVERVGELGRRAGDGDVAAVYKYLLRRLAKQRQFIIAQGNFFEFIAQKDAFLKPFPPF